MKWLGDLLEDAGAVLGAFVLAVLVFPVVVVEIAVALRDGRLGE